MSRPDYDFSQEEITKLRLLLNQAESQRDAFKAALHSEVKDIMRRAVSQATYDARYDAEASLKEYDEAENTIAQLKAKLENRDREVAALKAEADRFKAENERLMEIIRREVDGGVDLREEAQRTVEENHNLRAELASLRASSFVTAVPSEEYEKLKAEVERLRKWMDDISLDTEGRLDSGLNVGWTLLKIKQEYNAAKEGKPLAGQEGWWGVVPPPQEGEVQS